MVDYFIGGGFKFMKWRRMPKTRNDLGPMMRASQTDKFSLHHYEYYYNKWLSPYQNLSQILVLELGVHTGKSLNVWRHYFKDPALILGLAYKVDMSTVT